MQQQGKAFIQLLTQKMNFDRLPIFYEFVILVRSESIPESESESESTPWVRIGIGVGVTQKPIDSAALALSAINSRSCHAICR